MKKLITACEELQALSALFGRKEITFTAQEADGLSSIIKRIEKQIRKYIEKKTSACIERKY